MSEAIRNLMEAFVPETIDRRGYLYDDPTFGYLTAVNPFTSATDRLDGRFKPYYDSEVDLAYIRGAARNLALLTPVNAAALDRWRNTPSATASSSPHRAMISSLSICASKSSTASSMTWT